jgi:phosphonate transport system ATP-binding protein
LPAPPAAPPAGLGLDLSAIGLSRPGADGRLRRILDAVNLQVASGEQLAIVGPSGAGKSSLLQVAAGALAPDSGRVLLDGSDFWGLAPRARQRVRRTLFLAPQVPPLPPRQRVVTATLAARLPAMGFLAALLSLGYPLDRTLAHDALGAFGLEARLFDRVDRLSGGERQRVGLARALVSPARLWLLDEPLAALDPVHAAQVLEVLCAEANRRGVTLVVSLHHADLARAHFTRLVGLRAGRLVFDRNAGELADRDWTALYAGATAPQVAAAAES